MSDASVPTPTTRTEALERAAKLLDDASTIGPGVDLDPGDPIPFSFGTDEAVKLADAWTRLALAFDKPIQVGPFYGDLLGAQVAEASPEPGDLVAVVPFTVHHVRIHYSAGSIHLAEPGETTARYTLPVLAEEARSVQPGDAVELVLRRAAT